MKNIYKIGSLITFSLGIIMFVSYFWYVNNTYLTVSFKNDIDIVTVSVLYNNCLTRPNNPQKDGYTFRAWQLNGKDFDFNEKITKNLVLNATWEERLTHQIGITLENIRYEVTVYDGDVLSIEDYNLPSKDGYFIQIYQNNKLFDLQNKIVNDLELKGVYVKNET